MERGLAGDAVKDFDRIDISLKVVADSQNAAHHYPESDIKEALASIGKTVPEDELNCSSCGYDSCRDFAVAMLDGIAEDNMCASYTRKVAHDEKSVL